MELSPTRALGAGTPRRTRLPVGRLTECKLCITGLASSAPLHIPDKALERLKLQLNRP